MVSKEMIMFFIFCGIVLRIRTEKKKRELREKKKQQRFREVQIEIEKVDYGRRK